MYIPTNDEMIFHSAHLYVSIHTSYIGTYVERKIPVTYTYGWIHTLFL